MNLLKHLKSKTQLFNLAVASIGIIELNMHLLRDNLGEHFGVSFIAVSIVAWFLRSITTEAIDAK